MNNSLLRNIALSGPYWKLNAQTKKTYERKDRKPPYSEEAQWELSLIHI